jgi:hypothetical protein
MTFRSEGGPDELGRARARKAERSDDRLPVPFPDLPVFLEIAPGVEKHQAKMTGRDWDNALAISRARRDQTSHQLAQLQHYVDGLTETRPAEGPD